MKKIVYLILAHSAASVPVDEMFGETCPPCSFHVTVACEERTEMAGKRRVAPQPSEGFAEDGQAPQQVEQPETEK